MLRIALITRRFPPLIGGAEKVLSYLAPALAEAEAEVTVLTSSVPGLDLPVEERVVDRLRVRRLPTSGLRFIGTLLYMRALRRALVDDPPDVAYVSMLKHDAYVAIGVGRRLGFPVILRPEGAGATGDIAWQGWGRFGRWIARRTRSADAVVAISAAIRAELEADGYDPARIVDRPNGVPVPEPAWSPRPAWTDAPRAMFVGRLAKEKGLDALVEAWPRVRQVHLEARLTLIGEGPERPTLEALVVRHGLGTSVAMPGSMDEPVDQLCQADLFVLPSHEEGMSIALLEAMGLGIPVVASAIPGNQRLVDDEVHGLLALPGDPSSIAEAILRTWAEPDAARVRAQAARERVRQGYSVQAMARQHLELFRDCLSRTTKA